MDDDAAASIEKSPPPREIWELGKPDKLYDRDDQLMCLSDAYLRCCVRSRSSSAQPAEVVMISGPSGAGKTILAMKFKETVLAQDAGGYFISGKFDQLAAKYYHCATTTTTTKSYEPLVAAITELCDQVVAAGEERVVSVRTLLKDAMSEVELTILQDFTPALAPIIHETPIPVQRSPTSNRSGVKRGADAENSFICVLCRFVQAICSSNQSPLVLFLDDIQWANPQVLELFLRELLIGAEQNFLAGSKFMLLCSYRNDEVTPSNDNNISTIVEAIKDEGVLVTNIQVSSISDVCVNEMLSSLLHADIEDCRSLADIVHDKTDGNVFFVWQLLRSLREENLLVLDEDSGHWHWDVDTILQSVETRSVLQLLIKKIEQLPQRTKEVLKIASCLGVAFDERMVWCAGTLTKAEVAAALQRAEEKGLVRLDKRRLGTGKFVHDKIQQAVYSLVPESERPLFHLKIGRKLSPVLPLDSMEDDHLLLVADQISRGFRLIDDPDEKIEFAELYLAAGQKAALSSAFSAAAAFLNIGISLLGTSQCWEEHYCLTLNMYNTAAEIEYYNSNLDRVDFLAAAVLQNARKFEDALQAHFTRIYSLGTRGEMVAACREGFSVLRTLGEKFPSNKVTVLHKVASILSFKRMIRGKQDVDILNLHAMEDKTKLTALRMILVVAASAFYVQKEALVLLYLRLITRTLRYGMNDMCSAGFAALSIVLAMKGETEQSCRYGMLALQLFDKYEAKEWQARVYCLVYGGIYHLRHPYRQALQPLRAGHRSGLVLGDIQFSMVCTVMYSGLALECSVNLPSLAKEITSFRDLSIRYRLYIVLTLRVYLQVVYNFMGKSDNPLVLTGDILNEGEALQEAKAKNQVAYMLILVYKQFLAICMDDMAVAQTMSKMIGKAKNADNMFPFILTRFAFQEAFVAARLASTSNQKRKEQKRANTLLVQLRAYAEHCPQNFQNKVYLVEAELLLASNGGHNNESCQAAVVAKYQQSIEWAKEHNLIHEQALANERAGHFLRGCGRLEDAREYFRQASACYSSWGALVQVHRFG